MGWRLGSVENDLGNLRRAFGWLHGLWGLDRCAARRRRSRGSVEIDMLTWERKLVDVVDAELEGAVLFA